MKRKGQLTLFIIFGVIALVLVISLVYFAGSMKVEKSEDQLVETNKVPSDLEPLINYFESCLGRSAKKGLFLLGDQGGVIYTDQGGPVLAFPSYSEGALFLEDSEGNDIIYFIDLPASVPGYVCARVLPEYPINITSFAGRPYPFRAWDHSTSPKVPDFNMGVDYTQAYCFGSINPIDSAVMMSYLKSYIDNNIQTDCDFSAFRNFMINTTQPDSEIKSNLLETSVFLKYPMTITNLNSGTKTYLENFKSIIKLSFDDIDSFINMVLRKEIDDPTYPIWRTFGTDYSITIEQDVYNHDDLITITSNNFFLDGVPFKFKFARRNRYPVLEYIYGTSFDAVNFSVGEEIIWDEVFNQNITAIDPDEDEVILKVILGDGAGEITNTTSHTITPGDIYLAQQKGYYLVNITASDGQYTDFQTFKIIYP